MGFGDRCWGIERESFVFFSLVICDLIWVILVFFGIVVLWSFRFWVGGSFCFFCLEVREIFLFIIDRVREGVRGGG